MAKASAPISQLVSFRADAELLRRLTVVKDREDRKLADVVRRLVKLGLAAYATKRQL